MNLVTTPAGPKSKNDIDRLGSAFGERGSSRLAFSKLQSRAPGPLLPEALCSDGVC